MKKISYENYCRTRYHHSNILTMNGLRLLFEMIFLLLGIISLLCKVLFWTLCIGLLTWIGLIVWLAMN